MPITSVLPKALFPIVDRAKRVRAVLHVLLEDLTRAGIDQICMIVSPGQEVMIRMYLDAIRLAKTPTSIHFVEQSEPQGFGHAVMQAGEFVGGKPFLLLLGDHAHLARKGQISCVRQVIEAFQKQAGCRAMIGMHDVDESVVHTMGTAAGVPVKDRLFRCGGFVEKPDAETARKCLRTEVLPEGKYLAHCGIYGFDAEVFECLQEESQAAGQSGGEIELAAAQLRLLQRHRDSYYLYWIEGKAYDMGNPEGYLRTFAAMAGFSVGQ